MALAVHCLCTAGTPRTAACSSYERRRPEETALYRCVEEQWPEFRERAEERGGLPRFVVEQFEAYLGCGRLDRGLLRLACRACGFERLVAFSCKKRGFCPACCGRRMNDAGKHLRERVLPRGVPVRQWVCSLPWRLRYLCGYNRELASGVLGAFVEEVMRSLRHRARRALGLRSVRDAHPGAVLFVQRGDSALRLNVHGHVLALDGVYVRDVGGALAFQPLAPPTAADVAEVAARTARRAARILARSGRSLEGLLEGDGDQGEPDALAGDEPALALLYGAATQGLSLFGPRAGDRPLRLVEPALARAGHDPDPSEPVAVVRGFNVHAKLALDGSDTDAVERLVRYMTRPPIAQDRLESLADGRVRYTLKKAWRDGTRAIVLEPLDLLARLCALVPPPRWHLTRYFGVLSSHASLRAEIVPPPPSGPDLLLSWAQAQLRLFDAPSPPSRHPWSSLLAHVFREDVTVCPNCTGPMRWIELCTTPEAIARALARQADLGTDVPSAPASRRATARAPPPEQLALPFVCTGA